MSWSRGAGEYSQALQALAARGVNVGLLGDAPQLSERARLAVTMWGDLSGERQVGMSLGPIPWRAIVAWCDRYGVKDSEVVIELVQAIDSAWLHEHDPAKNSGNPGRAANELARGTAADDRRGHESNASGRPAVGP